MFSFIYISHLKQVVKTGIKVVKKGVTKIVIKTKPRQFMIDIYLTLQYRTCLHSVVFILFKAIQYHNLLMGVNAGLQ